MPSYMFGSSPFQTFQPASTIPDDAEVIFVADVFRKDYVGGAELTTDALITFPGAPKVGTVRSRNVTMDLLEKHVNKWWVFGNFSELNPQLIPSITANLKYSILEYDYKFCKYRSPEKHQDIEKSPCDCDQQVNGKFISAFFYGAEQLFWMSDAQMQRYHMMFPFLTERQNTVLSSVFDEKTLDSLQHLRETFAETKNGWIVLGSNSWVKGFAEAEEYCKQNNLSYETVWNVPYEQLLSKMAKAEGFVYLPAGADTCPRMVIEAKLLGCKLVLNDFVQHRNESWFATDDIDSIVEYLRQGPKRFWDALNEKRHRKPTLSGYTTTYNCTSQRYPFLQCIRSMLEFCDEVCIVDGGSDDDTLAQLAGLAYPDASFAQTVDLQVLAPSFAQNTGFYDFPDEFQEVKKDPRIKVRVIARDWNHPRFAVFDGQQKAEARKLCTSEFCWQMDSDEIVHPDHYKLIRELIGMFPKGVNLLSLPVVEYWGGYDKVRMDVTPWKWRLSRNLPSITHGIPGALRLTDGEGNLYSKEGTDGCDMIDANTLDVIPHLGFYDEKVHGARMAALQGNPQALAAYQGWFNQIVENIPGVFHYSWFDLPRKIRTYKGYWGKHWKSLFDKEVVDTAENNMMFDKPWADVTDADIDNLAQRLSNETGGWIWHRKWTGQCVPHVTVAKAPPPSMKDFYRDEK